MSSSDTSSRRKGLLRLFAEGAITGDELTAMLAKLSSEPSAPSPDSASADRTSVADTARRDPARSHEQLPARPSASSGPELPSMEVDIRPPAGQSRSEELRPKQSTGSPRVAPFASNDRTLDRQPGIHGEGPLAKPAARTNLSGPVVGELLGNQYELVTQVGRGGMGIVWKAWDRIGSLEVCVKLLPPEIQFDHREMERVKETFTRVERLQHEHLCPLYSLLIDDNRGYYLVMKYIEGTTLGLYRRDYVAKHGSFSIREMFRVLSPVARCLDYIHKEGILHRDLKPANILVGGKQAEQIQIVDLGLAAEVRGSVSRVSQSGHGMAGTAPYMAPEQWRGQGQGPKVDQYALAIIVYELLTGSLPFDCPNDTAWKHCATEEVLPPHPAIPPALLAVLQRGRAPIAEDRYSGCGAFLVEMTRVMTDKRPAEASSLDRGAGPASHSPVSTGGVPLTGLGLPKALVDAILIASTRLRLLRTWARSQPGIAVSVGIVGLLTLWFAGSVLFRGGDRGVAAYLAASTATGYELRVNVVQFHSETVEESYRVGRETLFRQVLRDSPVVREETFFVTGLPSLEPFSKEGRGYYRAVMDRVGDGPVTVILDRPPLRSDLKKRGG
jgi:serine/threonine protein kinase